MLPFLPPKKHVNKKYVLQILNRYLQYFPELVLFKSRLQGPASAHMNVMVLLFMLITRPRASRGFGSSPSSGASRRRRRRSLMCGFSARPARLAVSRTHEARASRGKQNPRGLKCVTIKRGQRVSPPRAATPRAGNKPARPAERRLIGSARTRVNCRHVPH